MEPIDTKEDETEILAGLRSLDKRTQNEAIKKLYNNAWINLAGKAVSSVGGKEADVEDIFQESLAALVKNVMKGRFRGDSKLSTYFYEICRRRAMGSFKKGNHGELNESMIKENSPSLEILIMDREQREELSHLVNKLLNELGEPCAGILKFRSLDYSYEEISEALDYGNPDTAKNQAGRCRKRLRENLNAKPEIVKKIKILL